jgi:DNA-binding response OmpR family regulator
VGSLLLVEPDPDTRDRLGRALQDANHEVVTAGSTQEAFLRVSEGGIDLVLLDSYDPRVGVVDFVRGLETLPDAPPIVLLSSSPHAPEISARIGAAAFLPKPFEPEELVSLIDRLVGELRPVKSFDDFDENAPTDLNRELG